MELTPTLSFVTDRQMDELTFELSYLELVIHRLTEYTPLPRVRIVMLSSTQIIIRLNTILSFIDFRPVVLEKMRAQVCVKKFKQECRQRHVSHRFDA